MRKEAEMIKYPSYMRSIIPMAIMSSAKNSNARKALIDRMKTASEKIDREIDKVDNCLGALEDYADSVRRSVQLA